MPRTRAHLPDSLVRLAPVLQRMLDLDGHDVPNRIIQAALGVGVAVDRADHGPPDVMLALARPPWELCAAFPTRTGRAPS